VYVAAVEPVGGYTTEQVTITIPEVGAVPAHDTIVTVVSPNPAFVVTYPNGDAAVDQVISFSLNLPGVIEQTKDTVVAGGLASPGRWIVASPCDIGAEFCRPVQRVIATPVAGDAGFIDVDTSAPVPPAP
jgi:hypothetical protein